jgi:hypothetical protein
MKRKIRNYNKSTGFKGVSKAGKKFRARGSITVHINGKTKHLGMFTHARDAANAYDHALVKTHRPHT